MNSEKLTWVAFREAPSEKDGPAIKSPLRRCLTRTAKSIKDRRTNMVSDEDFFSVSFFHRRRSLFVRSWW